MAFLAIAASLMTGCAQVKMSEPTPGIENIQKIKSATTTPIGVEQFTAATSLGKDGDKSISVRSNNVSSPYDSSFAKYLQETLTADIRAAGLLDPKSNVQIKGQLTESKVDPSMGTGTASVSARFQVQKTGVQVFDKELHAKSSWDSSFVGAIAIPAAINGYTALYQKLVGQLLDDSDFRNAIKP